MKPRLALVLVAGMAIVAVSNSSAHATEVVNNAVAYIEELRLDVEIIEEETEVID